uniref:Uncharacterized protein n=1 Tax=Sphaerodactylus townsendi TaxID=933632 RepID=A0ACB8FKS6_9SAUR
MVTDNMMTSLLVHIRSHIAMLLTTKNLAQIYCWLSSTGLPLTPQCDMDSSCSEEFYQAVHHAEQTFRKMESYLKQQQLCDVILIAGNRKIPAHRCHCVYYYG